MADRSIPYPSVFSVDGRIGVPPLPPKPGLRTAQRRRRKMTETVLILLVSMALIGILVEACFIYYLQSHKQDIQKSKEHDTPKNEAQKGGKQRDEPVDTPQPTARPRTQRPAFRRPSKPVAHVVGAKWPPKDGLILWNEDEDQFHELKLADGKLEVQKEGFYYIYSKLTLKVDGGQFSHRVLKTTPRYKGPHPIELLHDRYAGGHRVNLTDSVRNSYLGGVFHLFNKDSVFVEVKKGRVLLNSAGDNFFGMFMV